MSYMSKFCLGGLAVICSTLDLAEVDWLLKIKIWSIIFFGREGKRGAPVTQMRLYVFLLSPGGTNRSSFRNIAFSSHFEFQTMDKVQKPSDAECHTPLSEPFTVNIWIWEMLIKLSNIDVYEHLFSSSTGVSCPHADRQIVYFNRHPAGLRTCLKWVNWPCTKASWHSLVAILSFTLWLLFPLAANPEVPGLIPDQIFCVAVGLERGPLPAISFRPYIPQFVVSCDISGPEGFIPPACEINLITEIHISGQFCDKGLETRICKSRLIFRRVSIPSNVLPASYPAPSRRCSEGSVQLL
jgi:hypothetical protein